MATKRDIPGMAPKGTIPGMAPKGTIPDMGTEADIPKNATLELSNKDPQVRRKDVAPDKPFRRIV